MMEELCMIGVYIITIRSLIIMCMFKTQNVAQ